MKIGVLEREGPGSKQLPGCSKLHSIFTTKSSNFPSMVQVLSAHMSNTRARNNALYLNASTKSHISTP